MCPYTAAAIVWPLADVMFDRGSCRNSFASDAGSALDWGSGGALDLGARPSRFGVSPAVPADDSHGAPTSSDVPSRPASTTPSSDISAHAAAATDTGACRLVVLVPGSGSFRGRLRARLSSRR